MSIRIACLLIGALSLVAAESEPGLMAEYFALPRSPDAFPDLTGLKPVVARVDGTIDFGSTTGGFYGTGLIEDFAVRWRGAIRVEQAGTYRFFLASDDGSVLRINGAVVVDNGGLHDMQGEPSGEVELGVGEHPLELDYFEKGGGAGCKLSWQPPGGDKAIVPAEALRHSGDPAEIEIDEELHRKMMVEAARYGDSNPGAWYNKMDRGPVLVNSIEITGWPQENWALKGLGIRLPMGEDAAPAGVVFDTELLRWAAATEGGDLALVGIAYDGKHGKSPGIAGMLVAGTSQAPGVAAGDAGFADPRGDEPFGPLPGTRYGGYHLHGGQVVIDYTVGTTEVLERPSAVAAGDGTAFVRSLQVGPRAEDLHLVVAEAVDGEATSDGLNGRLPLAVRAVGGGVLRADGARLVLDLPAGDDPLRLDLLLAKDAAGLAALGKRELDDLTLLQQGGPERWTETVTVAGAVGGEDGPYAVDTITLPVDNPYGVKFRVAAFDLFADGKRAAVSTWAGEVWVVDGIDADLDQLTWRRFAAGLFHPLGLRIVDDRVFVLVRDGITELIDLDGDGAADRYRNHNNAVHVTKNFHEFAFDLQTDTAGNFYFSKAGPVPPGGRGFDRIVAHHGCLLRVSADGSELAVVATGLRAPNGIGIVDDETWTSGDNQGSWTPACRLNLIKEGDFMQVPPLAHRDQEPTRYGPPICWIPMGVDNSGGSQVVAPHADWGLPVGQLLHASYGKSSIFVAAYEVVDGVPQGGLTRLGLSFQSSAMRLRFSPVDGQLYLSGLRGWQTNAPKDGCFHRIRATGKPVHVPVGCRVTPTGIALTFNHELDQAAAEDADFYQLKAWNYNWSKDYGSPDFKPSAPGERGRDEWPIKAVTLLDDQRTIHVELERPPQPVMQYQLNYLLEAADGSEISGDFFGTINVVPE